MGKTLSESENQNNMLSISLLTFFFLRMPSHNRPSRIRQFRKEKNVLTKEWWGGGGVVRGEGELTDIG